MSTWPQGSQTGQTLPDPGKSATEGDQGLSMLTGTEKSRLVNSLTLGGRPPLFDDPRVRHLLSCTDPRPVHESISDGTACIDDETAEAIEIAFGLTKGWVSILHTLAAIETVRLDNFHMLRREPAMKVLVKVRDLISRHDADHGTASQGDTLIDDKTAAEVERAYGLPPGRLSTDHR